MGLTIHWSFEAACGGKAVQAKLQELRSACMDLPFENVGEPVWLRAEEIGKILADRDHPLCWAMIQAEESVAVEKTPSYERSMRVLPQEVIGFSTWPGEGCEEANFFLARYPASVRCDGRLIPTELAGWTGRSFCKTQYASTVSMPHFLRCHLTVIAALDRAKELGLSAKVSDEGDYWIKRDIAALAREVGDWNEMIAGLASALGAEGVAGISPITEHPDFAAMQEAGLKRPNTAACARKLAEIAKKLAPKAATST